MTAWIGSTSLDIMFKCNLNVSFGTILQCIPLKRGASYLKAMDATFVMAIWLKPATLLKVTLLHGRFSRFLNCTNGTKSRKASHLNICNPVVFIKYDILKINVSEYLTTGEGFFLAFSNTLCYTYSKANFH